MIAMTATDAKNRFGQALEIAQAEPVAIQKNGRDVAYIVSAEQFNALQEKAAAPKVRPAIERLMARSVERRRSLYQALAK